MYHPIQLTIRIPSLTTSKNGSPSRLRFFLIPVALVLACFTLSPAARAVIPAPDGGYFNNNTAEGEDALFNLTTGGFNTAIGASALYFNTTGGQNTANGALALYDNTEGYQNTANGAFALVNSETGNNNTATGSNALASNTTGSYNTASGSAALAGNTSSNDNTATGWGALNQNITGGDNTATGLQALLSNVSGGGNTATGVNALFSNSRGSNNIGLGIGAGGALTTGDNNIDIGNAGVAGESAKIRIGTKGTHKNTYIAGINGVTVARGIGVIIDTNGHLGTVVSSERFKDEIKPMDMASEAILALEPVTFRYKQELDPDQIPQFGLVAEQVAKINPDLVARDEEGKPYTVRYEAVNAMLLNEFLKEHRAFLEEQRTVEAQEATITQLKQDFKSRLAQQEKQIKALTSGLEKVNNQLELDKPAPQMVSSGQ